MYCPRVRRWAQRGEGGGEGRGVGEGLILLLLLHLLIHRGRRRLGIVAGLVCGVPDAGEDGKKVKGNGKEDDNGETTPHKVIGGS